MGESVGGISERCLNIFRGKAGVGSQQIRGVCPSVTLLTISLTVVPVLRITGLPIITFGLTSMRSVAPNLNLPESTRPRG